MDPFSDSGDTLVVEGLVKKADRDAFGEPDPHYRYKMPPVIASGTKHYILLENAKQIAEKLEVEASWIAAFIGAELGCQSRYSLKKGLQVHMGRVSERDAEATLQRLVYDFIDKFVLCPSPTCKNPEFGLKVESNGDLGSKCPACGYHGLVIAPNHSTCRTIIRSLKERAKAAKKKGKKAKESRARPGKNKGRKGAKKKDTKKKGNTKREGSSPEAEGKSGHDDNDVDELFHGMSLGPAFSVTDFAPRVAADYDDDDWASSSDDDDETTSPGGKVASKFFS